MKMKSFALALIVTLTACDTPVQTSPELDRLRMLEEQQRFDVVADHQPECVLNNRSCAAVYRMTASACIRLSPGNADRATCAVERFTQLHAYSRNNDDLLGRLEGLRQSRESASNSGVASGRNAELRSLSLRASGPFGGFYQAESLGWAAAFQNADPDCSALAAARGQAEAAAGAPGHAWLKLRASATQLVRDLDRRLATKGCNS